MSGVPSGPPGSLVLLAELPLLARPGTLPGLYRVRVDADGLPHDEVWTVREHRWHDTTVLVEHRAGRCDDLLEELDADDARRLAVAKERRAAAWDGRAPLPVADLLELLELPLA